jgi:hypothetical protein
LAGRRAKHRHHGVRVDFFRLLTGFGRRGDRRIGDREGVDGHDGERERGIGRRLQPTNGRVIAVTQQDELFLRRKAYHSLGEMDGVLVVYLERAKPVRLNAH